jgi:hypothetical protein
MKKYILIGALLPCITFAAVASDARLQAHYQALCIKEPNPLKRHHYCYLLDKLGSLVNDSTSYKDTEFT